MGSAEKDQKKTRISMTSHISCLMMDFTSLAMMPAKLGRAKAARALVYCSSNIRGLGLLVWI